MCTFMHSVMSSVFLAQFTVMNAIYEQHCEKQRSQIAALANIVYNKTGHNIVNDKQPCP